MSVPTISKSILTDRNSVYTEQSIIEIVISPEEVPLLNTSQGTYLKFLLQMDKDTTNCLAQPDPMSGGTSVIQTISIYSNSGQLLEQLEDVNTWTAMYYHYSKNQGLENLRTLMEGVSPVEGTSLNSQYFISSPLTSPPVFRPVECVIPLYMSGLLGQGNGKILPIVALGGLRIRIELAKKDKALRALTQLGYSSSPTSYVGIEQVSGTGVAISQPAQTFVTNAAIAPGAITSIAIVTGAVALTGANTVAAQLDFGNIAWQKGQHIFLQGAGVAGADLDCGPITNISEALGVISYDFASVTTTTAAPIQSLVWVNANTLTANFKMTNVEMICSTVQAGGKTISGLMNQMTNGGGIRIDYPSYNLYRQNLQAGIPRSELLIPATEQRAMSIVSEPMRSTDELFQDTLQPVGDNCDSYIWNIANRLTPNRRVSVERVMATSSLQELKWDSIHLHETEKAIGRCDIVPRNLCENARLAVWSRELAKSGHSFNCNDNEIRLNVEYRSNTPLVDNIINKLVDTWLYHIRTVTITPNSVAVDF